MKKAETFQVVGNLLVAMAERLRCSTSSIELLFDNQKLKFVYSKPPEYFNNLDSKCLYKFAEDHDLDCNITFGFQGKHITVTFELKE